jgi:EamA domain-containing membrane protein RarD
MYLIEEKGADITFDEQYWNTRKCYFQEIAKSGDLSLSLVQPNPFLDHTVVVADILFQWRVYVWAVLDS